MKGKLRMSPYRRAREELLSGRDATRIQAMADLEAAIRADQQRIDAEPPAGEDLTREELQGLVDELGTQAYRAEDTLAFIAEMCGAADADGSEVTTARVRSWLGYTGCGGVIVLPEDMQKRVRTELGLEPLRTPATDRAAGAPVSTRERLLAKYPVALEELDADPDPSAMPNAEDCPQCTDPNPPYPFICPGHPADIPLTSGNTPDIEGEQQ